MFKNYKSVITASAIMTASLALTACGSEDHNTDLHFHDQVEEAGLDKLPFTDPMFGSMATSVCIALSDGKDRDEFTEGLYWSGLNEFYTLDETDTFVDIITTNYCPDYR